MEGRLSPGPFQELLHLVKVGRVSWFNLSGGQRHAKVFGRGYGGEPFCPERCPLDKGRSRLACTQKALETTVMPGTSKGAACRAHDD